MFWKCKPKKARPLRVGLTGGIASGKTVVAEMFRELGVTIIDTDVIARAVVEPGEPALEQIRQRFGSGLITADGSLDRTAMRQLVFSDDKKRRMLEEILHPLIQQETKRQAETVAGAYQVVVVPLLAESELLHFVDRVLVVDCDESVQIERLIARDAESEEQARRILAAQTSREKRLTIADDVIRNNLSLDDTRQQVSALHETYVDLSPNGNSGTN